MTNDGTFTYTWDGENRLNSVSKTAPTSASDKKLVFDYDYLGRRVGKQVFAWNPGANEWSAQCEKDTRYVYDGWNVVEEVDATVPETPVLLAQYTWGLDLSHTMQGAGGIGGLLAKVDTLGTASTSDDRSYWYTYDANGNVGQLLRYRQSESTVTLAAAYDYDPYGNTLATNEVDNSGAAAANKFRFSTKWLHDELAGQPGALDTTGLYYYGYRYYSPNLGRWISRDPVEEDDGPSLYAYVSNAVTDYVDYLGRNAMRWPPPPIVRPPDRPNPPNPDGSPPAAGSNCGIEVNRSPLCFENLDFRGCNLGHTWIVQAGGSDTVDFPPDYIEGEHKCQKNFVEKRWKTKTVANNKRSCADIRKCLQYVEDWWAANEDFSVLDRSCRDFSKEALSICGLQRDSEPYYNNKDMHEEYCCSPCGQMSTNAKYTHPR